MSDYLKKEMYNTMPKVIRIRLISLFGKHYYQHMDQQWLEERWDKVCHRVDGVHSKEDLLAYVNKKMMEPMDLFNLPPLYAYLVPDYSETESVFFVIGHHSFVDGVQFWSVF